MKVGMDLGDFDSSFQYLMKNLYWLVPFSFLKTDVLIQLNLKLKWKVNYKSTKLTTYFTWNWYISKNKSDLINIFIYIEGMISRFTFLLMIQLLLIFTIHYLIYDYFLERYINTILTNQKNWDWFLLVTHNFVCKPFIFYVYRRLKLATGFWIFSFFFNRTVASFLSWLEIVAGFWTHPLKEYIIFTDKLYILHSFLHFILF